ncbi:anti-phage dCTP deaminase [Archangium sp.]|uniref:anti-phage dCTP deaminase n=1 Tax=Archangium sp. TaxID=1872627 RepID=UPI002D54F18B|nr:anti-phage dCTP deaminase [Archangium sp.]HYO53918.1 anti-phage dCTP deaminase [Archangium sp.]
MIPPTALKGKDAELVLGIVAAVGTDLDTFVAILEDHLHKFRYKPRTIRTSQFLARLQPERFGVRIDSSTENNRLWTYMDAGRKVREATGRGDLLALHAILEIFRTRQPDPTRAADAAPKPRQAYVIRSLKHPDEVQTLRQVYQSGFFLIGLYSTEKERRTYLTEDKACTPEQAARLIERDRDESDLGQRTRDTFALADVFIRFNPNKRTQAKKQVYRFLDIIFGNPHLTPTQDEHAMFLAHGAALRSGDLSRQVGAVITSVQGDLLATGANDVPRAGGGLYWPGKGDKRDSVRGYDANERRRDEIALDIYKRMLPAPSSDRPTEELLAEAKTRLKDSLVWDITEYGRAVHAEMEAILSCTRTGGQTRGATLYSTTFPCHNCAKHIIGAGISRVVFVEPYPKSQAMALHHDSIALERARPGRVLFEPFIGLGPRRFMELFALNPGEGYRVKRKVDGKTAPWDRATANLRVPMLPSSYVDREQLIISELNNLKDQIHADPSPASS